MKRPKDDGQEDFGWGPEDYSGKDKEGNPKKEPEAPEPPKEPAPEPEPYVSKDHFGSREAGQEAVLANTSDCYKEGFRAAFRLVIGSPGFMGVCSQLIVGIAGGMPPRSNAVPGLMNGCVRQARLRAIAEIRSPYDMRKKARDKRHEHPLRIWGYPDERAAFLADPPGWQASFWAWWHQNFPPNF